MRIGLERRDDDVVLAIADDGCGIDGAADGTGLSIVRALVRDELGGALELATTDDGFAATVVFPAARSS